MALYRLPVWRNDVSLNGTKYVAVGDGLFSVTDAADVAAILNMGGVLDAGALPLASASQAAITDTAGEAYTTDEQTMLANIKTLVNQLRADLVTAGIIKGSA